MMTKKIYFLLTFLLTTLGGGNSAWAADSKDFTSSNKPNNGGAGSSETIGNITVVYGNTTSEFTGENFTYSSTSYYGLHAHKTESGDLDGNIPKSDSDNFYLKFTTYYEGTMSVNFYNDDKNGNSRGLKCYKKSTSGTVSKVHEYSVSALTMGTLTFDMEPGYTYYVYDTNTGAIYYTGFSFTPEAKTNSVEYSHTWNFNYGENNFWPNTVGAMLTANNKWVTGGFGGRYQYTGTVNTSGGDALYDGNGNLVEETRGLKFSATNASDIQTDLHYDLMLKNGASVIIPSAKIGQTVSIWGWWPSGKTISVTNAKTSDNANSVTGTGAIAEFVFAVTANADVTITVSDGDDNFFFYSISINKSELTTFAFNNTETYYGESTDSPSDNNQCTGEFIDRTTTFKYKVGRSQVLRTRVDVAPGFDVTSIPVNTTNFAVSSNTSTVLGASSYTVSKPNDGKIWYWGVQVKKPGTESLTYRFNGTDAYNAKSYVQMITIEKDDPVLAFASNFITKTQGDPDFTNNLTLNGLSLPVNDDNAGEVNVTYSSDNHSAATVHSSTGVVTIGTTPGVANIKVTLAATDYNNEVEKTYKLIVNPTSGTDPVLSWNGDVSNVSVQYNQNVTRTATETVGDGQTIKYRSADTSVASVDATGKVTGTGVGSTTIYAYVEPTSTHNYAEINYNVTVTSAGELESFKFIPNNGKVNNGKSITPKLAFPTIPASGVTSLKVTQIQVLERNGISVSEPALTADDAIADCDIIRVDASNDLCNNWELDGVNKVFKVNVTINGKKVGKARITVTFVSDYYNTATATYDVEVTEAGTTNFSWTEGSGSPEYYTYEGDFMMLPALTGNSNGNYNYSSGAKNSSSYTEGGVSHSALHAYEYERKWDGSKFNIKWNNKNIKIGEGFPDFAIVTDEISSPGTASVFFGRGEGSSHPDTLMVYCETAGDVKLRAYDPQDHTKYCDATIHILPISNIEGGSGAATTIKSGMTYPYTWDFTTNFDMANMVGSTDQYWMPIKDNNGNATGEYTNGYGFFNLDWADVDKDNATNDRIYKHFIIGASNTKDGYMHQFNGMMLQMKGSTSWANRIDRMRILNYDGTNNRGRLQFIGGYHTLKIHVPTTLPSSFKIFVKASGTGKLCIMGLDEKAVSGKEKSLTSAPQIYSFDNTDVSYMGSEGYILLGFDDARVDWIAMSTEAKSIGTAAGGSDHMASYSYGKAMDYNKSEDANDVKAYVATSVSPVGTTGQYLSPQITLSLAPDIVPSGTGVILKANEAKNAYMIADAQNKNEYPAPSAPATNYLKGTTGTITLYERSSSEDGRTRASDGAYIPFVFSSKYTHEYSTGQTSSVNAGYYSFWRINNSMEMAKNYAYMVLDAVTYADAWGVSSAASVPGDMAGSRVLIIFDDEEDNSGTTGISTAQQRVNDNEYWYTLQGVRVDAPTKGGIYIHKGRKVVVK